MKYFATLVILIWSGLMLAALPGTGAISFSAIQTEFGGTNPIAFNEYYRNGGLVPTNGTTGSIATSGAINVDSFHGAAATTVSISTSGSAGTFGFDTGYSDPTLGGYGTMSPTTTSDGKTIMEWYTTTTGGGRAYIVVDGFSSDPGQTGWATSFKVTGSGVTRLASAATVYSYSAGTASWRFDGVSWGFVNGNAYTASIP